MPIYEYRCRACGRTDEVLRPLAAADDAVTCTCGASDSVRLPSLVARTTTVGAVGAELPMAGGGASAPAGGGCCGGGCCS
jgi:putative FmdB family regulatory protein